MSYANITPADRTAATPSLSAMLSGIKEKFIQRRAYRQTVAALSQLNTHELKDLGLNHGSIQSSAWNAVYGTEQR